MADIYCGLTKFFNESLVDIAKQLNYSNSNIIILEGKEIELKNNYPDVYKNILTCVHNRDNRTPFEYARDLVSSWVFEDYLISLLNENGLSTRHAGNDKKRVILSSRNIGSESDTILTFNSKDYHVEIVNDYTGFWKKTGKLHLRDSKYEKLKQENSHLLAFSIKDKLFAIIHIGNENDTKFIAFHWPFHKPAYEIKLSNKFVEFTPENLVKCLKESLHD